MDKELRLNNKHRFQESLGTAYHINTVSPYSASALREHSSEIARAKERIIVFDITCLTRAHIIALASILVEQSRPEQDFYFSYTAAESYSIEKEMEGGWKEVLLLPVGNPTSLRRGGHARGIVLTGHDTERLSLALNEVEEPEAGCIISSFTRGRPDLMRYSQQVNKHVTEYLLSLRMPRMENDNHEEARNRWKTDNLAIDDYSGLEKLIRKETEYAIADKGPVLLFPFGPKNLVLTASVILASVQEVNAWAAYPIPFQYDVDYSQKTARVYWMRLTK